MDAAMMRADKLFRNPVAGIVAEEAARFRKLTRQLLVTELSGTSVVEFARHDYIYAGGGRDRYVYVIERGQVKTQIITAGGKRCLLSFYAEDDVFGETALLGIERPDSAVALSGTVLRRVPAERFRMALTAKGLEDAYLRYLTLRLLDQQKVIADMVTMTSELRLAARLLDLASLYGTPCRFGVQIGIRFTHEDLADMVGTTRSRIGHFLKRFRQAGFVQLNRQSRLLVHESGLAGWIEREACSPRRTDSPLVDAQN